MKIFLACLLPCLIYGCATVEKVEKIENPVTLGSSISYQVNHFQGGEMLGIGNTEARVTFSKSGSRRVQSDSILRENYQTVPLQPRNRNAWTAGIGFQGGFADWLDGGVEAYLSFEDSLSSRLMISGKGVKFFAKFPLWNLDSIFHIAVMPVFAYTSGTDESDNIGQNPLSIEAASGKLYSLGSVWELVLPMSYRLSPVANLTFAPKMFWIRRTIAFEYVNVNEPRINFSRSETQYERIPSVSFGVEIGEKGRRIHPEATWFFDDGEAKFFFGVAFKF